MDIEVFNAIRALEAKLHQGYGAMNAMPSKDERDSIIVYREFLDNINEPFQVLINYIVNKEIPKA